MQADTEGLEEIHIIKGEQACFQEVPEMDLTGFQNTKVRRESPPGPAPNQNRRWRWGKQDVSIFTLSCELAMNYVKAQSSFWTGVWGDQSSQWTAIVHNELKQRDVFNRYVQAKSQL